MVHYFLATAAASRSGTSAQEQRNHTATGPLRARGNPGRQPPHHCQSRPEDISLRMETATYPAVTAGSGRSCSHADGRSMRACHGRLLHAAPWAASRHAHARPHARVGSAGCQANCVLTVWLSARVVDVSKFSNVRLLALHAGGRPARAAAGGGG